MVQIRALSYNIHKGFTASKRDFVLEKMKEAIHSVDPDIIFLQEVVGHHESEKHEIEEWPTTAQFEYLAHELTEHYIYGKNAVYTKGHHGNALLSKFPIISYENINISTNLLEKRGVLHGIIEIPDLKIKIHSLCLHLNLLESGRRIQIKRVCERMEQTIPSDEAIILAGDFNDWRRRITSTMEKEMNMHEAYLKFHGKHAKTFPSTSPLLSLDRIYFRGLELVEVKLLTEYPWNTLSDHVAIVADFETNYNF